MKVEITNGLYAGNQVNGVYDALDGLRSGRSGHYVNVDGSQLGYGAGRKCRVKVSGPESVKTVDGDTPISPVVAPSVNAVTPEMDLNAEFDNFLHTQSDEEIIDRTRSTFQIVERMTRAAMDGTIHGLIVSGPAGIGKSHAIETISEATRRLLKISGQNDPHCIIKGNISAVALYMNLFNYSARNEVVILDDADIFNDEACLNILKAALDTKKRRIISWKTQSNALKAEDIPDQFEFKGSIIFLTNYYLDDVNTRTKNSKIGPHLEALVSRCYYIDLEIKTIREKMLRIEQVVKDGMLNKFKMTQEQQDELLKYFKANAENFRELSLRTMEKVAKLYVEFNHDWEEMVPVNCFSRGARFKILKDKVGV